MSTLLYWKVINSVTAQRLGEEGIDSIEQLALSNPKQLSIKTRFPQKCVYDWRYFKAVLFLVSGDIHFEIDVYTNKGMRKKNPK